MTAITVTDRYGYKTTKTTADLARLNATLDDYLAFHLKNGGKVVGYDADANAIMVSYETS